MTVLLQLQFDMDAFLWLWVTYRLTALQVRDQPCPAMNLVLFVTLLHANFVPFFAVTSVTDRRL